MSDLTQQALRQLQEKMPGRVSTPGDRSYTVATSIWAKPAGPMPRVVVHCRGPEDVQVTIRTATDCQLPLSVRGGGHDWAGRALCAGIVIDMSGMNDVVVGPDSVAAIGGGTLTADVLRVTDPLGLAAVTGSVSAVGMTGLTLGGGYGPLIGRFGLACDNMIAAEVVLADGRIVLAKDDSEEELFWALRGGGGNFGVVTAMWHRLHDLKSVWSGMFVYPISEARTVLGRCAEIAESAPDDLSFQIGFLTGPDDVPVVFVLPTWSGAPQDGEALLAPFFRLGTLLVSSVKQSPYGSSLAWFDSHLVKGRRTFMESCWIPALDDRCIEPLLQAMAHPTSPGCAMLTHDFKGAASRVPPEATAFGLRHDHVLVEILAMTADRCNEVEVQRHHAWTKAALGAFDKLALPGGYPNLLPPGEMHRASKSYGSVERLIKAKGRYDPDNVFCSAIPMPAGRGRDESTFD
jgi:FAD binding domain